MRTSSGEHRRQIGVIYTQHARTRARGPAARVEIVWTRDHERSGRKPQRLHLTWSEKNGPPVQAPAKCSFGTRLIETLGHQLKGDVRLTYELTVFVYALDVPLASLTSQRRVTRARNGQSALTALTAQNTDFRSSPESGLRSDIATCPKSAKTGSEAPGHSR